MQKIIPHLWFDTEAVNATAFYASLFPDSKVDNVTTITGTPSGDADIITFTLLGEHFMAISAGPYFKINPSVSLFVTFDTQKEIDEVWNKLAEGGKVMMPYQSYPWAKMYGWLEDKYGLSWQLSLSEHPQTEQRITPMLMFTNAVVGKAKEAIETYTKLFPNSKTEMLVPYEKGEVDTEGFLKHSRFMLGGFGFMAMDSSAPHKFNFNEAISFVVNCDTQEEIDKYWELSAVPESEQCGWLKDKFGVSWQIVPSVMNEMMTKGSKAQMARVTQAFLKMKKFDIAAIKKAYEAN